MAHLYQNFSARLRALRDECGMTADQLAAAAKQSKPMIHKIEQSVASPSFANLLKLSLALGVEPVYLFVFPGDNPLHDLFELTRGQSRKTLRAMLRACTEIAAQAEGQRRAVGE